MNETLRQRLAQGFEWRLAAHPLHSLSEVVAKPMSASLTQREQEMVQFNPEREIETEELTRQLVDLVTNWDMPENLALNISFEEIDFRRGIEKGDVMPFFETFMPDGFGVVQLSQSRAFNRFLKSSPKFHLFDIRESTKREFVRTIRNLANEIKKPSLKLRIEELVNSLKSRDSEKVSSAPDFVRLQLHLFKHRLTAEIEKFYELQNIKKGGDVSSPIDPDAIEHFETVEIFFRDILITLTTKEEKGKAVELSKSHLVKGLNLLVFCIYWDYGEARVGINEKNTREFKVWLTKLVRAS